MKKMFLAAAVFAAACSSSADVRLEELTQVVIHPGNPYEKLAADEFQRVYEKATGKKIEILSADARNAAGSISLKEDSSLKHDGYRVELKGETVRISGRDAGSVYGVYALLRKFGWKYYTLDCEVMPQKDALAKDFSESRFPAFDMREANHCFTREELNGFPTLRLGYSPYFFKDLKLSPVIFPEAAGAPSIGWPSAFHNTSYFAPVKLRDRHSGWFAKNRKGELKTTSKTHYHACTTNPEYRTRVAALLKEWLRARPEGWYIDISQGDGNDWCECPDCLALDPVKTEPGATGHANMSDRYLDFANYLGSGIQKEFPDAKLNMLVYCGTTEAPLKTRKIEKNVVLMFCPYPPNANCHSHDLNCPQNEKFLKEFQKWITLFPDNEYSVFDYPVNYANFLSALFSMDAMIAKEKFFAQHRVKGFFSCGYQLMLCDLSLYLQSKVLWDPSISGEELKKCENEFIDAYYGPAAPGMKKLLELIRERIGTVHQGIYSGRGELSRPDYVIPAYGILDQCEADTKGEEPYAKRVRFEKLCAVLYTDLSGMVIPDPGHRLKRLREFMDLCREFNSPGFRGIRPSGLPTARIPEWLKDGFNLKMTGTPSNQWYDDNGLKCLYACRTKADFDTLAKKLAKENEKPIIQKNTEEYIEIPPEAFKVCGVRNAVTKLYTPQGREIPGAAGKIMYGGESMSANFLYDPDKPFTGGKLILQGQDHDKGGKTEISIWINKKPIFKGKNTAAKDAVTTMEFPIPDHLVKKGLNTVELLNDSEAFPQANWFACAGVRIAPSNYTWTRIGGGKDFQFLAGCHSPCKAAVHCDPRKNETEISLLKTGDNWSFIQLFAQTGSKMLAVGKRYRTTFQVRSEPALALTYLSLRGTQPYNLLSERVYTIHSEANWKQGESVFKADGSKIRILQMNLGNQPEGGRIFIRDLVLEEEK